MSEECANTSSPKLQIRRPSGLRRCVEKLCGAFGLTKSDKDLVKSMFSSTSVFVPVYTSEFQCEVAFSFWGYVKNDQARLRLLEFFFCCMQPRLYMAGETLPGHFLEAVMIVKLDRLHIYRDAFAKWIEAFFEIMPMSAGTTVFEKYLGEQMLTSMRRIQHSTKLRTNSFTEWNKDFLRLYLKLEKDRTEQERVMSFTGLPFTSENFIDIHQNRSPRWPRYNNSVVDSRALHNIRQILVRNVQPAVQTGQGRQAGEGRQVGEGGQVGEWGQAGEAEERDASQRILVRTGSMEVIQTRHVMQRQGQRPPRQRLERDCI